MISSDISNEIRLIGELNAELEARTLAEAALRGVGKAAELIDLTKHQGAHPRLGATDVVPFIPVEGVTIEDSVALARRVGREIWERYRIPVYFYEAAAQRPDRVNLEDVRRGQFEGVREEVLVNPNRAPDVGEPRLHATAGATIVGARKFLIAYNINLNTSDIGVANKIARAIRFSTGGLRYVKSMGVHLTERDLADYHPEWVDPISIDYRGLTVEAMPPNTQGVTFLEELGLLDDTLVVILADHGEELLEPQPEGREVRRRDEGDLVASLAGQLGQGGAERDAERPVRIAGEI